MYRHCIYCSADLRANEAIEGFPVGRTIAFDAAKGRLWAVCPRCGRWNLAPLEERWEPVEQAERVFQGTRLRVQSENIGVARLADGVRLVRIGDASPGEIAVHRYSERFVQRRRQQLALAGGVAGMLVANGILVGAPILFGGVGAALVGASALGIARVSPFGTGKNRPLHRLPPERSGGAGEVVLRGWHMERARLVPAEAGAFGLEVPFASATRRDAVRGGRAGVDPHPLVLSDPDARAVLARGGVYLNALGGGPRAVREALDHLGAAGSVDDFLGLVAGTRTPLMAGSPGEPAMAPARRLALEMALHEESERRALEGELTELEAAWREAEEIARIADRLAIAPGGDA